MIRNARDVLEFYNLDAATKKNSESPAASKETVFVELSAVAAKIFEVIPQGDFITEDEILDMVDDVTPQELPQIMIELELKGCIVQDAGRYRRQ